VLVHIDADALQTVTVQERIADKLVDYENRIIDLVDLAPAIQSLTGMRPGEVLRSTNSGEINFVSLQQLAQVMTFEQLSGGRGHFRLLAL
jgi:hypothetical protein